MHRFLNVYFSCILYLFICEIPCFFNIIIIIITTLGKAKQKVGDNDEKGRDIFLKPYVFLDVQILREYLEVELNIGQLPWFYNFENSIDDWVFLCFFVGNDFLPHLPSLEIREGAIDTLITIWKRCLPMMGGYITIIVDFR